MTATAATGAARDLAAELARDLVLSLDPVESFRAAVGEPDPWQADLLRSADRQILIASGRQIGKSTCVGGLAVDQLNRPSRTVLLLSPSLRQSSELFDKVRHHHRKAGGPPITAESAARIETANGSRCLSLPSSEATVRGFSAVDLIVIDEAARVPDSLYAACRPMLAVSGGRLVALSTPHGKRGWFAEAWHSSATWKKIRIPSSECPRISAEFLQAEREALPRWVYNSEYRAIFEDAIASVFRAEEIAAAFESSAVAPLWLPGEPVELSPDPEEPGALWSEDETAAAWRRLIKG